MADDNKKEEGLDYEAKPAEEAQEKLPELPKEVKEKLKKIKEKLDKFSKEIVKKFESYIMGVALLPPPKPQEGEQIDKNKIHVLVLVDDSDSTKMSKYELNEKLTKIIEETAKGIDENIAPQVLLISDLWQACYDGKYEILQMIAMAAPIHDTGMLSAIKIAEIHKTMTLKKFEKYIVAYVLAGSLVQGKATPESDIDVFLVIDDTDVKRMTRAELKDKLRAIIIGMGLEAGELTGIKNKLNIQVYILTDFWENIKEANPIIFTFLRDGVPFYDRGVFMPWKQLLKMGRIKPSGEAIEMYMSTGEQVLKRIAMKINEIAMEDLFYAILTPSQAALMMYGVPPPTPKETPVVMREIFVQKEKLLEESYIKILEKAILVRKQLEHGTLKNVSGKELDDLISNCDKYLVRLKKLFSQIEKRKEEESMVQIYETIISIVRDVLTLEGIERAKEEEVIELFNNAMVSTGKIPEKYARIMKDVLKAKKDYDQKKLTKTEVAKVKKESAQFIRFVIEYMQRKKGKEFEKARIRVKHGETFGEVVLLGDEAFIIHDIKQAEKDITRAKVTKEGTFKDLKESNLEELEKALASLEMPPKVYLKEKTLENLKTIFGSDVEVMLNY